MNRPFRSPGLGAPWYSVFGNHDALLQGNVPGNAFFSQVAGSGCIKVTDLSSVLGDLIKPLDEGRRHRRREHADRADHLRRRPRHALQPARNARLWSASRATEAQAPLSASPTSCASICGTRGTPAAMASRRQPSRAARATTRSTRSRVFASSRSTRSPRPAPTGTSTTRSSSGSMRSSRRRNGRELVVVLRSPLADVDAPAREQRALRAHRLLPVVAAERPPARRRVGRSACSGGTDL